MLLFNDEECLSRMQTAGWVHKKPAACPHCRCRKKLSGPQRHIGRGKVVKGGCLYYRCSKCKRRFNCLKFSKLPFVKMSPGQLHTVLSSYTDFGKEASPSSDDLATLVGAGRHQVRKIVDTLRSVEAMQGEKSNKTGSVQGDVEMDEHGIRVMHIGKNNPHYQKTMPAFHKGKGAPSYWLLYLRVIGLRRRGGDKTYVKLLPFKLVRPGAKPPPLSNDELTNCGLLERIKKGSVVLTDGAQAYQSVITSLYSGKLLSRNVVHSRMEFTRTVRTPKGHSNIAGTQSIDRIWQQLDKAVPASVHNKANHEVNPMFVKYVWAWLFRHNNGNADGYTLLAKFFQ